MTTVLTQTVARLLLTPIALLGIAMLVKGYASVGDGFAGGLVVSLGVLIQYLAFGPRTTEDQLPIRRAPQVAFAGLVVILAVALQPLVRGEPLLTHWPPPGEEPIKLGTIELVTGFALDLGIFMLVAGGVLTAVHAVAKLAVEGNDR